ncbi:hypothetical protein JKG68_07275 [Microvirga aerilata]|uniref:Uncharacterized protein n=1 Tax=Microvirga aerilata TaxID=670292 RepID=A0A936ZBS8_9HYPH|nr:hypothetical protein [Microvirga aerilata]MBL0403759.1 hypothetical protein [Microvirga aerilata]
MNTKLRFIFIIFMIVKNFVEWQGDGRYAMKLRPKDIDANWFHLAKRLAPKASSA